MQFAPDGVELFEQDLEDPAFVGAAGHQIDDAHVVLLAVAVDAPHTLFEARRIPGDVVVHHRPAELEVDPFARGIGGH